MPDWSNATVRYAIDEIIAKLPAEEQATIEARYQVMKQEVEGLGELRRIAGKPRPTSRRR